LTPDRTCRKFNWLRIAAPPLARDINHGTDGMPSQADVEFLRSAVACGALAPQAAREVLAALEQVEKLGARASAREIAVNRGLIDREQADTIAAATPTATPAPAKPGRRLANFLLLSRIGSGGMGVVFRAIQLTTGRHVALKILPRRFARDRAYIQRFLREAQAAAKLDHPNIVRAIDAGEAHGRFYFAMELVAGETLKQRIRRLGPLPEDEVVEIGRQVAMALEHASARGIVHRDVKPANILITPEGVVKLADLGLARHAADGSVTIGGAPIGTPLYMSPEQAKGREDVDVRSDIYSLGATLYHAATGSPPFTGPNSAAIITKHLFERPAPPSERRPQLSEDFSLVVLKMLAKRPADRYQSPARLIRDLERVADGRPPIGALSRTTSNALRRTRRRKRSPIATLVTAAMAFACLAGLWCFLAAPSGRDPSCGQSTAIAGSGPTPATPLDPPRRQPQPLPATVRSRQPAQSRDPAMAELRRALEWANAGSRKPEDIIRVLKRVIARHPGSAAAARAQREIARLQRQIAARENAALQKTLAQARDLCSQERFAQAAALLDTFARDHPRLARQADQARGEVVAQAVARERQLRDQARRLVQSGDFDAAIALYQRIASFGLQQLAARARREISLLQQRKAKAAKQALEKARDAYLDLRLDLRPLLAARRYREAAEALRRALSRPELRPLASDLEADLADIRTLMAFWEAARRGAASLQPGTPFSIGGIRGKFVRFQGGTIEINASGITCRKSLDALKPDELVALAARGIPEKAQAALASALFLLVEGRFTAARKALAEAREAGADPSRYLALVERWRADALELKARQLLASADNLARQEKWDEVAKTLAACRKECGTTRTFARNRRRIEQLSVDARCATLTAADLFNGAARTLPDGRIALSYDFSDPAQLADWQIAGNSHALKNGTLVLESARALHRAVLEAPIDLTVELADASGPPGEWLVGLGPDAKSPLLYSILMPERPGLPLSLMLRGRVVATARASFPKRRSRAVSLVVEREAVKVELDAQAVANWQAPAGADSQALRALVGCSGRRSIAVASVGIAARLSPQWVETELGRLKAQLRRNALLAAAPWRPLFDGQALTHWHDPAGVWTVADGAASTPAAGVLRLRKLRPGDFELRLRVRPAKATSVLALRFRLAENGETYAALLGGRPPACRLLYRPSRTAAETRLADYDRLDWQAGRWYDVGVVALGAELALVVDGTTVATAQDPRLKAGAVELELRRGGAVKDMAIRLAE